MRPLHRERVSEIEIDPRLVDDRLELRAAVATEQERRRDRRDPLRHERLRRRDEQDRLLEQPAAAHEQLLLAAALAVVTGVGLVDRDREHLEGGQREVDVDLDPAPQLAEVLAERHPRDVADDLDGDAFALGKRDEIGVRRRAVSIAAVIVASTLLRGNAHRALPPLEALRRRSRSGKQLLELLVRSREHGLVGVGGRTP